MSKQNYNSNIKVFCVVFISFLMISVVSAYVSTLLLTDYLGLIIGSSLMVITIPFAIKFKKNKTVQIEVSVLNAIFTGMAISTFFAVKGYTSLTALLNLIYAALICVVVYFALVMFGKWNILNSHPAIKSGINFALFLGIIGFYVYGYLMLNAPLFYALSTLTIITFGIYFVSVSKVKTKKQLYNHICLSSYCIYIVVACVVLMFVSEGDAADFGDVFVGWGTEKPKDRNNKKSKITENSNTEEPNKSDNNSSEVENNE